jgi:hypothetical protein
MAASEKPLKGKAWIRSNFKSSPDTGSYLIPNEVSSWGLLDFYRETRAAGFIVEATEIHEYGLKGFVAIEAGHDKGRTSGPVSYEIYFAGVATHGRKLDPDDSLVSPEEWQSVTDEHSGHDGVIFLTDKKKKMMTMICYCRSSDGVSVVRRVLVPDLEAMDKTASAIVDCIMAE